jgi:DNA modification methylase
MIEPYWSDGKRTVYCGDAREIVPQLEPVDLVLTDPPYGINYKGGGGGSLIHSKHHRQQEAITGDSEPFDPSLVLQFRHVALFGAQHYYASLPAGGTFHIWDKRGEYEPVHTSDFDTIWVNRKEVGRKKRCVWRGLCREVENRERILHPTQKPLKIIHWVLGMFPDITSVIDPYMGSGTTLRAAKESGLHAIGIEIEERYCEIAARRLSQSSLFDTLADIELSERDAGKGEIAGG